MSTHRHIDPSSRSVNIKLDLVNPSITCRPIEYFETPLQLPVVASYLNKLEVQSRDPCTIISSPPFCISK